MTPRRWERKASVAARSRGTVICAGGEQRGATVTRLESIRSQSLCFGFSAAFLSFWTGNLRVKPGLLFEMRLANLLDSFPFGFGIGSDAIVERVFVVFAVVPPFGGVAPMRVEADRQVIPNTIDDNFLLAAGVHNRDFNLSN